MPEVISAVPIVAAWLGMALFVAFGGGRSRRSEPAIKREATAAAKVGEIGASVGETPAVLVLRSFK